MATVDDDRREYRPIPYSRERLPYEDALAASESFLRLMQQRRSIRHFSTEPVPRELIDNALRTAASAPSGANQQPWTFVVVSDAETKERIRIAAEHEETLLYHGRASDEYLGAIKPIGTNEIKPHISGAPYIIVVFEQAWGHEPGGSKRKHYYVRESVGIAVGLLLAALHTAGLATLTHAPSPMGFLKEILERPENERPFLLIPVGYPSVDAEVPDLQKKELDDVVVYIEKPLGG